MGLAYLPDGTMIDYQEYIQRHPHWQKVRKARFDFDEGRCAICHKDLTNEVYQTHHLSYLRLGRERLRDVITLCNSCHQTFHQNWCKSQFWAGKEEGHWNVFDLNHTARLCSMFWRNDRLICRDPNALFEAEKRGLGVTEFLDEYYGEKVRGKNPLRQEAGRKNGPFDHTPESFHRHYSENKNINILMEEVREIEGSNQDSPEGNVF